MNADTITGDTAPFNGSEQGVAPRSDSSHPNKTMQWLVHHRHGWQFGEQGILEALARDIEQDIPEENRWCVEFGAGDGHELPLTCDPVMRKLKWRTLLIDGKPENCERLRLRVPKWAQVEAGIVGLTGEDGKTYPETAKNIDEYMEGVGCPSACGLLVVDIDSFDYYIVARMKARPYILCVEHMDEQMPDHPRKAFVPQLSDCGKLIKSGTSHFHLSATSQAFDATMVPAGYSLVFRSRINSIYVRNDVVDKVKKEPDGAIRLNLGGGSFNDPRYTVLDLKNGHDIRKLPYPDNSVDEIYASHVLEHFDFYEQPEVLKEWARVLKPQGLMRIAVPDAKWIAEKILKLEGTGEHRDIEMLLYGAHSEPSNEHHAMFTQDSLREAMNQAGIGWVTDFKPFISDDCANHPCSLRLEGVKRYWPKLDKPKITLIISQPRFTFTAHEVRLLELARTFDMNIQWSGGAFWDRDMTCATMSAIARTDPDLLVYTDYDGMFEADDFRKLLEAINNDPYMAAIGSVQMSRHNDKPLVFEDGVDYSEKISRVRFQHFGLTIIRREVFDELPQPWFWSVPGTDGNGKWDWDTWSRSDADITFWRQLSMAGFRVYQHNEVCIGHMVHSIKYPRKGGKGFVLVPIENYTKVGKPKDVGFDPEIFRTKKPQIEASPPTPTPAPIAEDHSIAAMRGMGELPSGTEVPPSEHRNGSV